MALRPVAGLVCGGLTAALGALLLGEYELAGVMPLGAGLLVGLVVGEVVVGVGRHRSAVVALLSGALAAGSLAWAGWIDAGEGLEPVKRGAWLGAAVAAVAAAVRTRGLRARVRR